MALCIIDCVRALNWLHLITETHLWDSMTSQWQCTDPCFAQNVLFGGVFFTSCDGQQTKMETT